MPEPRRRVPVRKLGEIKLPSMEKINEMWEAAQLKRLEIEIRKTRPKFGEKEVRKAVLEVLKETVRRTREEKKG